MKIAITARKEITSKKGENFVLYSAVKPSGETLTAFISPEKDALLRSSHPTPEQVAQIFEVMPVVDVEFNELGRVENLSEIED